MSSVNQLLFAEAMLKGSAGLLLILIPGLTIKLLGLPRTANRFWPRMLGAILIGLAIASLLEGSLQAKSGLGLAGSIAINLSGIAVLGSLLILGRTTTAKRGRLVLWLVVAGLIVLACSNLPLQPEQIHSPPAITPAVHHRSGWR